MKPLAFIAKNVPAELRAIDSWLLWRLVRSHKADGTETWLKVPFYADGTKRRGALGTKADRSKLTSFDEALQKFKSGNYSGVGFATMPDYPLTILDLDKCIDAETGEMSDFAVKVIRSGTYVERSPSGLGLRAVYTGGAVCAGKRNGHLETGERVEIYCGSAFVTITGQVMDGKANKPLDLPKGIKRALEPVIAGNGSSGTQNAAVEVDGEVLMSPDAAPLPEFELDHAKVVLNKLPETWGSPGHGTWYRVAAALHLQFGGSEEAYALLDEWSQGVDGYDPEANRRRWDAGFSHGRGREGVTTMRNLVFESIQNGGLRVKPETMNRWGLARKVEDDFEPEPSEAEAVLPEFSDLDRMTSIGSMLDEDAEPVDWLVEGLLPRGYVTALAGGSGTSKSFFTLQLCAYGAVGLPEWGGMKICEGGFRTLYMAYEDTRFTLHRRIRVVATPACGDGWANKEVLGDDESVQALRSNLMALPAEVLDSGVWQMARAKKRFEPLEATKLVDYLRDYVVERKIDLVVFDTGSEIHTGDENSAGDMVVLMRLLRQLATGANCAALVVQHVGKDIWGKRLAEINQASLRGSGVLVDKARNVVVLARMPVADAAQYNLPKTAETHDKYVVMKHVKANLGEYVPQRVFERVGQGSLMYDRSIVEIDPNLAMDQEVEDEDDVRANRMRQRLEKWKGHVIEYLTDENTGGNRPNSTEMYADLMGRYGITDSYARVAVRTLEKEGVVTPIEMRGRPKRVVWVLTELLKKKGSKLADDDDAPA